MKISRNLAALAALISPLYIVGGAVRDHLLGYSISDIDLTGTLSASQVLQALAGTAFSAKPNSLKLGTLSIAVDNERYEYTAMREDSYAQDGSHQPISVNFTNDIQKDALRRDFAINAIYYDIAAQKIIDPLQGSFDIKSRTIRTTREPKEVLCEDALRILRLARLACENGLIICPKTLSGAREQAHLIAALAPERIQDELNKILLADKKNNVYGAHTQGIRYLVACGAMAHIIPQLLEGIDFAQNKRYHIYNVYEHTMQALTVAKQDVRLAILFHDIAKPYCEKTFASMSAHAKYSAKITVDTLTRLKYKPSIISETERLVLTHMFNLSGEARPVTIRRFIQRNYDILDKLMALKSADCLASREGSANPIANIKFKEELAYMKKAGIPFSLKDLQVNGTDALAAGLAGKAIGQCLQELVSLCASEPRLLSRAGQLQYLAACAKPKKAKRKTRLT